MKTIPTEPIGSIPRPPRLIEAVTATHNAGPELDALYDEAIRDTVARFEATGSSVITDGEQRKYQRHCLEKGACAVQVDFTEARLAVKIDPAGELLHRFIDLNNLALSRFSAEERCRIGVHTCPGSDRDSTHSGDVDYGALLPSLFELMVGRFYVALAGERDRVRVLRIIREHIREGQTVFVGVVDPIDPRIETPEEIRDRVLEAARHIPPEQLGICDDCGFSPFSDDTSTTRDTAFAKIRARVTGTALASEILGSA